MKAADIRHMLFDFFRMECHDGIYIGEDLSFCRSFRAIGGEVRVDTSIVLGHRGMVLFQTEPAAIRAELAYLAECPPGPGASSRGQG